MPTTPPTTDLDAIHEPDCEECFGDGCNACEPGRFCIECRADFAIGEMCGHAHYADNANERGAA